MKTQTCECTNCGTRIYQHEPRYQDTDGNVFCSGECKDEYQEDNQQQPVILQQETQEELNFGHMDLPLWQRLKASEDGLK